MAPKRIQRKRTKGWRMPENAVSVTRPGRWGNPYVVGEPHPETWEERSPEEAARLFRYSVMNLWPGSYRDSIRRELAGKDLACWCPLSSPCHGDILLEIANGGPGECP